jgi:hypothetical protein
MCWKVRRGGYPFHELTYVHKNKFYLTICLGKNDIQMRANESDSERVSNVDAKWKILCFKLFHIMFRQMEAKANADPFKLI